MNRFIISLCFAVVLFFSTSFATQDENDEDSKDRKFVAVPSGEVINKDYFAFGDMVPKAGLEPARHNWHCPLKTARLPVPPLRQFLFNEKLN